MSDYFTEVCSQCGNLKSVCSDPTLPWYPQRSYCYATAAVEQTWRRTWERFEHPDPKSPAPHVADGLKWNMSQYDMTPDDDFFGENRSGVPGSPATNGEADDQHHDADSTQ